MDVIQGAFNWIADKLQDLGNALINLLPNSPFIFIMANTEFRQWLAWANYFIPFGTFIAIGESWLLCVGIYYLYQMGLRWAKAID